MLSRAQLRDLLARLPGGRRLWQVVAGFLAAALLLGLGFWLGSAAVYSGYGIDPARYRAQAGELAQSSSRLDALQRELDMAQIRHDVDRESLELVRRELAQQNERIASLEEGIRFYRGLMAPGELSEGFSLRGVELVARGEPGRYGFRIVVQQEASEHALLRGELYAELIGQQDGESRILSLAELSDELDSPVVPLRFRYFQAIEGNLQLPEGFLPDAISVVAAIKSPHLAEVSEKYPWTVQGYFTRGVR